MLTIRPAEVNDLSLLPALIYELAEYERELDMVSITQAHLLRDGFGPHSRFRVWVAEWDGKTAGYALFYAFCSTWPERPMDHRQPLWLTDEAFQCLAQKAA
jgi:hypothetical protein